MKDITLVAGMNELNVAMAPVGTPPPSSEAQFVYANDPVITRVTPPTLGLAQPSVVISFEITNTGGTAGLVTPIIAASFDGDRSHVYPPDPQTIQPGDTVTFTKKYYFFEWYELDSITSEAGVMSFLFGRTLSLDSFTIPDG